MKKDILIVIGIVLLSGALYALTLRGAAGEPTPAQVKTESTQPTSAFELSPERGRYAQVANMAESGVYNLSAAWADTVYPDVGVSASGKYDSFFAPGVSYFALPFYIFGSRYGFGQLAAYAVESLASIITLVFTYAIGRRIFRLTPPASFFAVLVYGFASTSWGYSITLYEHAFSAMFAVTMFYAAWRFAQKDTRHPWLYAAYVWLAYALSVTVNYPDAVLMLPIMVYLAISTFSVQKIQEGTAVVVKWSAIVTFIFFALVIGLHFWHNATYYGGPTRLAGELPQYTPAEDIIATSTPGVATTTSPLASSTPSTATTGAANPENEKTPIGFFHEAAIPNGIFVLLFSSERGLLFFSPIFIFSVIGIVYAFRKKEQDRMIYIVPVALIVLNIFLYSAWGDPWGGWAYGPRYLIQSMPWLALFVGVFVSNLSKSWKSLVVRDLVLLLFMFSAGVSLLGALTTNAIPPKSEGMLLPAHEYNYLLNIDFLKVGTTGDYAFNTYFSDKISLVGYFIVIYILVVLIAIITLRMTGRNRHE